MNGEHLTAFISVSFEYFCTKNIAYFSRSGKTGVNFPDCFHICGRKLLPTPVHFRTASGNFEKIWRSAKNVACNMLECCHTPSPTSCSKLCYLFNPIRIYSLPGPRCCVVIASAIIVAAWLRHRTTYCALLLERREPHGVPSPLVTVVWYVLLFV